MMYFSSWHDKHKASPDLGVAEDLREILYKWTEYCIGTFFMIGPEQDNNQKKTTFSVDAFSHFVTFTFVQYQYI